MTAFGRRPRAARSESSSANSSGLMFQDLSVAVDEHRSRTHIGDGVGGRGEGERRDEHLVAGSDAELEQGEMDGSGATAQCDGVRHADHLGQLVLEQAEVGSSGCDPAGVEGLRAASRDPPGQRSAERDRCVTSSGRDQLQRAGRHANGRHAGRQITNDHRARPDGRVLADRHTLDDVGAGTDR